MASDEDQKTKHIYEFGPFRVDPERELLLRGEETVSLTPKNFQILLVLIRHSKELVTKDEMMKMVWPDTFVEEANLSRNIFMLRKALGESPQDHQYIVTVPGRGYRFAESVQLVPQQELSIVSARHATVEVEVSETRNWRWPAIAAIAALVIGAAGFWIYFRRAPVLTEKDAIVLADFSNSTGDSVFDGTLRQGTEVQLEQSPYLTLVSDQRIRQALSMMDQPANARLTPEIAREICERIGSTAVADGSIQILGTHYVLGLRARSCKTGNMLAEEQAEAARKEDVLSALGLIASRLRKHLGESIKTVEQHDIPLEEATTPSLEALKAYSAARLVNYTNASLTSAVPLLQHATEIDPNFAMAYAFLGRIYGDSGEAELSAENARKAYELRDHSNGRERFFIEVTYDRQVTGNLERAQQTLLAWAREYPRDRDAHGLLSGFATQGTGNYQKAIEEGEKAIDLEPEWPVAYANVAFANLYLNRLDEVGKVLQRASDRKLVYPDFPLFRLYIAFLKNDRAALGREMATGEQQFANQDEIFHAEALISARSGKLKAANEISRHAVELAQQGGQNERAAVLASGAAVWNGLLGNPDTAGAAAGKALQVSKGRDAEYGSAIAFALANKTAQAQSLLDDIRARFPEDTTVLNSYLPTLRGLLALNRAQPAQAIQALEPAIAYEGAVPGIDYYFFFGGLYSAYFRGEAYLAEHRGPEAAAEFQKILDHPGIVAADPIGALAYLQLGRAYAMAGDKQKAKAAYAQFLLIWKDADADVPVLKQAKAEYAKFD